MNALFELENNKKNKIIIWMFVALIVIQLFSFIYLSYEKNDFFIDETYSYIFSNSYSADSIPSDESYYNQWINGSDFEKFSTVQENERFSYNKVYYNSSRDQHPPLYYFILHTICSFFPNTLSKWTGLITNIVLFALAQILLFFISKRVFNNSVWSLVPMALYGGSLYAINTVVFIRMYMLSTLLTLALLFVHIRFIKRKLKPFDYVVCYLLVFLGTYTIYIFAIFAFFVAAATCIHLLFNKRFKELILYALSMLCGVVTVLILFPPSINQITGNGNYDVGKEIARSAFSPSELPGHVITYLKQMAYSVIVGFLSYKFVVLTVVLLFIILAISLGQKNIKNSATHVSNDVKIIMFSLIIGAILVGTLIIIALLSGKFTLDRYLYNVIPIWYLFLSMLFYYFSSCFNMKKSVVAAGLLMLSVISIFALTSNKCGSFIYPDSTTFQVIEDCNSRPWIVISNEKASFPTGNYNILSKCDKIYMTKTNEIDFNSIVNDVDINNGVNIMILTDISWDQGYDGEKTVKHFIDSTNMLSGYKKYSDCYHGEIYIAK